MSPTPNPTTVTRNKFTEILARYPAIIAAVSAVNSVPKTVSPNAPAGAQTTLQDLDAWRLDTAPRTVAARDPPFLTKDETEMLLACKMRRGKRRIGLPKLLAANSPDLIKTTTTAAFTSLTSAPAPTTDAVLAALKTLVDPIKGVGPATGSYILALIAPASVPVFSDEAYRWVLYASADNAGRGNDGWYREIKYDVKEYRVYLDSVAALAARLGDGVTAQDVEKVGFVLGKEAAADLTGGEIGGESAAAAKARIVGAKKLTGADALDTALGVDTVPVDSLGLAVAVPDTGTTRAGKRKKPDPSGSEGEGEGEGDNDVPLRRGRKARAPKKGGGGGGGRKMGWVFTGKK